LPAYWQDDDTLTDLGMKVFIEENQALGELRHVVTDRRATAEEQAAAAAAVAELTAADAGLALRAIPDAKAAADAAGCTPVDASCAKALFEIAKAESAYAKGRAAGSEGWEAVDRFREAWEHATRALGRVPTP
jgi:hypothetical protein